MKKAEIIGVRISTKDKDALKKICTKENRSISNLIGILIADYLKEYDKKEK